MNKFTKFAAATLLACGGLAVQLPAGVSMNWCSQNSSYQFVEFDVPSACSVSIYLTASSNGGTYNIGGTTGVWYQYTFLPIPTNPTVLVAGIVQSPYIHGFWDGPTLQLPIGSNRASAWVNVWGGGNSYSRQEFRCSDLSSPSSSFEYGQATAGHYYVDCDSSVQGDGGAYAYAIVDFNW